MIRRLISRLDEWARSYEGTVLETSVVWYDGTPIIVYIPHRTLVGQLKRLWLEVRNAN